LDDEAIPTADVILDPDQLLAVRERADLGASDGQTQVLADLQGQTRIAGSGEDLQIVIQEHHNQPLAIYDL